MEENEGKNLAAYEKIKAQFDANVINLVHRFKEGNMTSFEIGNVQVDIKKADKLYAISFAGYNLCSVDDKDKIIYNISELEKFKEKAKELMENGMPDLTEELGLPDIEYLKYLEKEKNKELEEGKDKEKGKEQAEEEKDKNKEEDDDKEKDKDKDKEEIAKKYGVKSNQVIHIDMSEEKITEDKTFAELVHYARDKEEIYAVPDKDAYSWKFIGKEKGETEFKEIEEANKQIHGDIPDVTVQRIDNEQIREIKPIKMYDIDGKSAIAIVKDQFGEPEMLYCRKQEGEQKYFGMVVPEASDKNVRQAEFKERSFLDTKNTSGLDLSEKADELVKAKELEERGLPSKKKGVQMEEIEGNSEQNRAIRKEDIKEDLYKRMGISEKMKGAMPGYLDYIEDKLDKQAEKILNLMENDPNITYEMAVEATDEDQREEGGITPGEKENRRH